MGVSLDRSILIAIFVVVIGAFLVIDLGGLSRKAHVVSLKESLGWTLFWFAVATSFGFGIKYYLGQEKAITFAAA